jgi:antitoxin VapB
MTITRVFKSGNSQAVRLPKEFQLDTDQVEIYRRGNEIIIRELPNNLGKAFELLTALPNDFMKDGREDLPPQERELF